MRPGVFVTGHSIFPRTASNYQGALLKFVVLQHEANLTRVKIKKECQTSLSARTLTGFGWSYLSTFIKAFLSLLLVVILARLLTPVEFGLFGIAWIFMTMGIRLGNSSIGPAIIQRPDLTDAHIQAGFTLSLIIGSAVTALIWLLAPFIGEFFNEPTAIQILRVLSMMFVINGIGCVPTHLLRRELRFRELMIADLLAYFFGYGITVVILAFQGYGVWSLVWGEIIRKAIHTIMVIHYAHTRLYPRWTLQEATELLSTGAGFSLARSFEFITRQGGYFVVGGWLGAASLGYFTRAGRLIMLPKKYVGQSLFQVLFPAMAQRQQGTERLATIYLHGSEVLSLVALPVSAMLFVCAPEIVSVILGGQWDPVVILLEILAFAVLFQMCDILNFAVIGAVGAVYRQAWRQGIHAFLVVGGAWYASRWGLETVVIVIVGTQVFAYLLLTQLTVSLLSMRWRHLLRCSLPALWVGAWAAVALWLTAGQVRAMELPAGLALVLELLVWFAALLAALYYAPSYLRPVSIKWALTNIPFEVLGTPGSYMRKGCKWLSREGEDY